MTDRNPLYRRHRFPAEIIANAVWLHFRFPLSCGCSKTCWRVEELLSRTRRSGSGQRNSAAPLPARSAAAQRIGSVTSVAP
jgi:hypothetical protein